MTPIAHGIGGQHDLPLSPFYAFAGAFAALLVSFLALGLLWSRSRFRGDLAGRPLPPALQRAADAPLTRKLLRALGLAAYLLTLAAALFGSPDPQANPAPGLLYAVLWAGLVPVSLLLGPVWRLLDPLRTLHALACRATGRDASAGRRELPDGLGHWPAAAGLLAYAWTELASPDATAPATVAAFLVGYSLAQLAGAARYGDRWFDRCDAFTVYSALIGSLAPLGRRHDGRLVLRLPFHGLDAIPRVPGLTATVCVLLGATGYDGFTSAPLWVRTVQSGPLDPTLIRTLGLLATIALVALVHGACTTAARRIAGRTGDLPGLFAHALVPVAVGYLIAHYLTLLLSEAPRTVVLLADPFATGAGTAVPASAALPGAGTVAATQVLAIVLGHVGGVVAAHDRAVRHFPAERALAGQIPLLVLMMCYTLGGLTLLFLG
ncbi:hypothetical protein PJ985_16115 [Streptomyces sp. ACA25]|uniref:hypothetical protein n=1 Tax=Streptomyces sp. ACA25 TaxID=3022596 RepID=UPI002307E5BF|nr:hypothetical protein [Streptomyces sp. ACA25]MDB1089087.1 hypothetical protein [Streptomyces sp. ACA25]